MSETRNALNAVWHDLMNRQERERQAVAGVLNSLSGYSRTADDALAELDRGLRALANPVQLQPEPLGMTPEQIHGIASQLTGDREAQGYLDRLR